MKVRVSSPACFSLVLLLSAACTTRGPYRASQIELSPGTVRQFVEQKIPEHGKYLQAEGHKPAPDIDDRKDECLEKYSDSNFWMGHVEFGDYGQFQQHRQLDVLERAVEESLRSGKGIYQKGALILVYVHGWQNNAEEHNGNLRAFRELCYHAAQDRECLQGGGVLGVYISWRGESLRIPGVSEITTYWSRKRVAEEIGRGNLVETLDRIKNLEWLIARRGQALGGGSAVNYKNCRLVLVGHSFGATALYCATAHPLEAAFDEPYWYARRYPAPADGSANDKIRRMPLVTGFGDLVLLINPAYEALPYQSLHYPMSTNYNVRYDSRQPVLMMILSSRNDWANGSALPVGQYLATRGRRLFAPKRDQNWAREEVVAMGQFPPFFSHTLNLDKNYPGKLVFQRNPAYFAFGVDHDEDHDQFPHGKPIMTLEKDYHLESFAAPPSQYVGPENERGSRGIKVRGLSNEDCSKVKQPANAYEGAQNHGLVALNQLQGPGLLPFMVVSVDPQIIDGHSGFWPTLTGNQAAYDFLSIFIRAQNKAVAAVKEEEAAKETRRHAAY